MQSKKEKRKCRMKKFNNIIKRHTYREPLENNIMGALVQIVMSYIPDLNLNKKMVLNDQIRQLGKDKAVIKLRRTNAEKREKKAQEKEDYDWSKIEEEELIRIHKFCRERIGDNYVLKYHGHYKGFTAYAHGYTYNYKT